MSIFARKQYVNHNLNKSYDYNRLLNFGYEYQNFIFSVITRKSDDKIVKLNEKDIETLKDLNKYEKLRILLNNSLRKIQCF